MTNIKNNIKLTKNFYLHEFSCHNGQKVPKKYLENVKELASKLQTIRDVLNKPMYINSAYRPTEYNKSIGGAKRSQHLTASAADITVKGMTPKQVMRAVRKLVKNGVIEQGGIGLYNSFIHIDIRSNPTKWDNSSLFNF